MSMGVDNNGNDIRIDGGDKTARGRNLAAFLAVSVAAVMTPFFGIFGFLAFCSAYAAATAACSSGLKYAFFIPGAALALFIYDVFDTPVWLGASGFGFSLICAAVLGVAIRRRQSAAVQTLSVTVTAAVLSIAAFVAWAMYAYGSVSAAVNAVGEAFAAYADKIFAVIEGAVRRYAESDAQGAAALNVEALAAFDPDALWRSLLLSFPGVAAGLALFFGWIAQLLSRPFLALFGRRDIVTDKKRIVLPLSLVVLYLAVTLIAVFSYEETLLTVAASNVSSALVPAIMCVGIGFIVDFVREGRGHFPAMLLAMFILSSLLMPTFFITAVRVVGVVGALSRGLRARMSEDR